MSLYLLICDNLASLCYSKLWGVGQCTKNFTLFFLFGTIKVYWSWKLCLISNYDIKSVIKRIRSHRGDEGRKSAKNIDYDIVWMAPYIVITWIYHLEQIKSVTSKIILLFVKEFQIFLMTDESKLSPIIAMILRKVHNFYDHLY